MPWQKRASVIRRIDDMGRIVIPKNLRDQLEIVDDDEIEITDDGDRLILRKYRPRCTFCGNTEQLLAYKGKFICRKCVDILSK